MTSATDGNSGIGGDIRALRKTRRVRLAELAAAVARSTGWLSQVERGQTVPSVRDLARIATFFNISISFFFRAANSSEDERGSIVRSRDRVAIGSAESGLQEELLSPHLAGHFEMIKSVFAPGAKSDGMNAARKANEGGYLVSGELRMTIGDRTFLLHAGDSFQFHEQPHGWENPGTVETVVIWIVSPPVY